MNRLLLLGLNHTTAPIDVRERLALAPTELPLAIGRFRERFPQCEMVLLSTCNRVELYIGRQTHGHPRVEEMISFLADVTGCSSDAFRAHLYQKTNRDVVGHLFDVASSLNSMVLGETQILGQVRSAYDIAKLASATGPLLNPLFQKAIAVGKQVMAETPLASGRTSVASVAVDCARQVFDSFDDKTILSIGAGEIASLTVQNFAALRPRQLLVCNRDSDRAERLADRFGGSAIPFGRLGEAIIEADVVVTSTGAAHPIVGRDYFEPLHAARAGRPMLMLDIALPRDIDPAVGGFANVHLRNLDDLQSVVATTLDSRSTSAEMARQIVARHVDEFFASFHAREMGPVIDRLYQRYHELAAVELERLIGKQPTISVAERNRLEELARRIVNKLAHEPVQQLRKRADGDSL